MVMVTVVGHSQLEAPTALGELKLLQKPHIRQQAQGAVDRRQGDLQFELCQLLMHLLSAEMAAGSTALKQGEHTLSLGSQATAILMESLLQGLIVMHRR